MANSVDPDQTAPIGAVCSGSTLFTSVLNSSVMLGNFLQQTTSADDIFKCIFNSGQHSSRKNNTQSFQHILLLLETVGYIGTPSNVILANIP